MSPDPTQLSRWLAATAGGDHAAFQSLYDATSAHLFGVLLRMLQRRDLAEDALQDCFVKIWQKAELYAPDRGSPMVWLTSVARYRALDVLRARRPDDFASAVAGGSLADDDGTPAPDYADTTPGPEALALAEVGVEALGRCLDTLAPEQRKSLLLAYYEGYTHPELASAMQAPLGTVKSWVRRGLMRLRECLETDGQEVTR